MSNRALNMKVPQDQGSAAPVLTPRTEAPKGTSPGVVTTKFGSTAVSESRMSARASRVGRGSEHDVVRKAFRRMALVPVNFDNPQKRDLANTQQMGRELATASRVGLLDRIGLLQVAEGEGTVNEYLHHEQKVIKVYEAQSDRLSNAVRLAISDPLGTMPGRNRRTWGEDLRELGIQFPATAAFKAAVLDLAIENDAAISRFSPGQEVIAELYAKQQGALRVLPVLNEGGGPVSAPRLLHGFVANMPEGKRQVVGLNTDGDPLAITAAIMERKEVVDERTGEARVEEVPLVVHMEPIREWLTRQGVDPGLLQSEFQGSGPQTSVSQGLLDHLGQQGILPIYARAHQEDLLPPAFGGSARAFGAELALNAITRCREDVVGFLEAQAGPRKEYVAKLEAGLRSPEKWKSILALPGINGDEAKAELTVNVLCGENGTFITQWNLDRGIVAATYLQAVADYQEKFSAIKSSFKESPFLRMLPGLEEAIKGHLGAEMTNKLLESRLAVGEGPNARPARNTVAVEVDSLFLHADSNYNDEKFPECLYGDESKGERGILGIERPKNPLAKPIKIGELDRMRRHAAAGVMAMGEASNKLLKAYSVVLGSCGADDQRKKLGEFMEKVLNPQLGAEAQKATALELTRQINNLDKAHTAMSQAAKEVELAALSQVILGDPSGFGFRDTSQVPLILERLGNVLGLRKDAYEGKEMHPQVAEFHAKVVAFVERDERGEFKNELLRHALDANKNPEDLARARFPKEPLRQAELKIALNKAREYMRIVGEVDLAQATFHRDFESLTRHLRWTGKMIRDHAFGKGRGQFPITVNFPEPSERLGRPAYSVAVPLEGRQGGETYAYVAFSRSLDGVLRGSEVKLLSRRELIKQGIEDNEHDVRMDIGQKATPRENLAEGLLFASNAMRLRKNEWLMGVRVASSGIVLGKLGISIAGTFKAQRRIYDYSKVSGRKSPFAFRDLKDRPLNGPHFVVTDLGWHGKDLGGVLFFPASAEGVKALGELMEQRATGFKGKAERAEYQRQKALALDFALRNIQAFQRAEKQLTALTTVVLMPAGGAGGGMAEPSIFDIVVVDQGDREGGLRGVGELIEFRASLGAHCEPVIAVTDNLVIE